MTARFLLVFIFIASINFSLTLKYLEDPQVWKASVKYNKYTGEYAVVDDINESYTAFGTYSSSFNSTGWDFLTVSSYQGEDYRYNDDQKSYAMGLLEGYLTSQRIWTHYSNMKAYYYSDNQGQMLDQTKEFISLNLKWMRDQAILNRHSDVYWSHVYSVYRQMEGIVDGYNRKAASDQKIDIVEMQIVNAMGDLEELKFYNKTLRPNFLKMTIDQIKDHIDDHTHCSALIKVAPDFSDVWFGHNTWTSFSAMTRIFKEYKYKSNDNSEKSKTVAFSSYPATLSSIDDFYITDADLYVVETTNSIFETSLYDQLTPQSLLTWVRTIVANRLSDNGETWTQLFAKYNSGTYNNQFQILDLKLIDTEKKTINDGALWVLEQIPGYTESADLTSLLRYGYWPSYNSAYFNTIREKSGYNSILIQKPEMRDTLDYSTCARANIFRRENTNVVDVPSYKKLIRYNDYLNDVLSKSDPSLSISCRGDLDTTKHRCNGAIDAKFASINDVKGKKQKKIYIIAGPTTDQQVPFQYKTAECAKGESKYKFEGLPDVFKFDWVEYTTALFDN